MRLSEIPGKVREFDENWRVATCERSSVEDLWRTLWQCSHTSWWRTLRQCSHASWWRTLQQCSHTSWKVLKSPGIFLNHQAWKVLENGLVPENHAKWSWRLLKVLNLILCKKKYLLKGSNFQEIIGWYINFSDTLGEMRCGLQCECTMCKCVLRYLLIWTTTASGCHCQTFDAAFTSVTWRTMTEAKWNSFCWRIWCSLWSHNSSSLWTSTRFWQCTCLCDDKTHCTCF